jgi:hypothetical protein
MLASMSEIDPGADAPVVDWRLKSQVSGGVVPVDLNRQSATQVGGKDEGPQSKAENGPENGFQPVRFVRVSKLFGGSEHF